MAECIKCSVEVGCPCNLVDEKYCNTCYKKLLSENKIASREPNYCNQTLDYLNEKLEYVMEQYKDRKLIKLQYKAIIKSQIRHFIDNPCKFYDIIKNIQ